MKITRSAGSHRWALLRRYQVHLNGKLFIDRLRVIQTPWFAVLLSRIYQADKDRDPHNHSRAFATFILSGAYIESVWPGGAKGKPDLYVNRAHKRFSLMRLPQDWAHSITAISDKPLRTLVIAGRHHGTWHFWTPDGPVDWKAYGDDDLEEAGA